MKVSEKEVKHLITALEDTMEIVDSDSPSSEYKRGYAFAIKLSVLGIKTKILNK